MLRSLGLLIVFGLLLASVAGNLALYQQSERNKAQSNQAITDILGGAATATVLASPAPASVVPSPVGSAPAAATASVSPVASPAVPTAVAVAATPAPLPSVVSSPSVAPAPPAAAHTVAPPIVGVPANPDDMSTLQRIEAQVQRLRGLDRTKDVPVVFLNQASLKQYFTQMFNRDYLPAEREADQKLYGTLGLVGPDQNLAQIDQDLLTEEVLGLYDQETATMYVVGDQAQLDPQVQDTFSHEFDHVLQDQKWVLSKIAPLHPENNDRAAAISGLLEGDAVLVQRQWAQQYLTDQQRAQLGGASSSSSLLDKAPLFLRNDTLFPYVDGYSFVLQAYQKAGGFDGVNALYDTLPQSTAQILHPEKYQNHVQPVVVPLADLSPQMGTGWRQIASNVLGELEIRNLLEQYGDRTAAAKTASGWAGDRWEVLEYRGQDAIVLNTVWESDTAAQNFFDVYGQGLKNRFPGSQQVANTTSRQALNAPTAATELRVSGSHVLAVISFDRASAEALATAVGNF